jgi:predicted dehydrogenase
MLANFDFGKIIYANFRFSDYLPRQREGIDYKKSYVNDPVGGGVTLDMSHELELVSNLFGSVEVVSSFASNTGTIGLQKEDYMQAMLLSNKNIMISVFLDFVSKERKRGFEKMQLI